MIDEDRNGLASGQWRPADLAAVFSEKIGKKADNVELFEGIKAIVEESVHLVRGEVDDDRYRNIVDLIMMRARAAIGDGIEGLSDEEALEEISDSVAEALSDFLENKSVKLTDFHVCQLADVITAAIGSCKTNEENSEDVSDQAEKEQKTAVAQTAETETAAVSSGLKNASSPVHEFDLSKTIEAVETLNSVGSFACQTDVVKTCLDAVQTVRDAVDSMEWMQIDSKDPVDEPFKAFFENLNGRFDDFVWRLNEKIDSALAICAGMKLKPSNKKKKKKDKKEFGIYSQYIDSLDHCLVVIYKKFKTFRKSTEKIFKKSVKRLKKVSELVRPKTLLERVVIWIKNKIVANFIKKLTIDIFSKLPFVKYFKDKILPILKKKIINPIKGIIRIVTSIIRLTFKLVRKTISLIWKGLRAVFKAAGRLLLAIIRFLLKAIVEMTKRFGVILWRAIRFACKFLNDCAKAVRNFFQRRFPNFSNKIRNAFNGVRKFFGRIGNFFRNTFNFFSNIKTKVGKFFSKIGNTFRNFKTKIGKAIRGVGRAVKNTFIRILKGVKNMVMQTVRRTIRSIIKVFKTLITKIMRRIGLNIA